MLKLVPKNIIKPTKRFGQGPKCRCGNSRYNKQYRIEETGLTTIKITEWRCTECCRVLETGRKEVPIHVVQD